MEYRVVGVEVFFAGVGDGVREILEPAGFYGKELSDDLLFPTVHDAVIATLDDYPDQQKELLYNVVDAPYADDQASSLPSMKKPPLDQMELQMPVDPVIGKLRASSTSARSRSNTQKSRSGTMEGYHNPALVVDDIMDLEALDEDTDAKEPEVYITDF